MSSLVPCRAHELIYLSAVDARDLLARRELSAREYISALLLAIDGSNRDLRAFIDVYADEALAEAAQFDEAPDQQQRDRPLAGIPFAVKDLIDASGKPTTAQSRTSDGTKAFKDAAVVRQLRGAGAILIGKLNLEECGIGSPLDETPWPPARNPWDYTRTTGGLLEWMRRCPCCRAGTNRDRYGHRRVHSSPCCVVRCCRTKADLRSSLPRRN